MCSSQTSYLERELKSQCHQHSTEHPYCMALIAAGGSLSLQSLISANYARLVFLQKALSHLQAFLKLSSILLQRLLEDAAASSSTLMVLLHLMHPRLTASRW